MKYKAVIFDLDGVICHTDKYHFMAWKEIAGELGVDFNEKINDRLRGVSRLDSLEIILENHPGKLSAEDKHLYTEKKNTLYREYLSNMSPDDLDPMVKETIDKIKRMGLRVAIGSSSKNARFIINKLGLEGYFEVVSDGTAISRSKPDPEVFLKASAELAIEPRSCLVVEDAKAGVEAARAAGMDCAAIGSAALDSSAEYKIKSIKDLLLILSA